jgi:hypothetical protein
MRRTRIGAFALAVVGWVLLCQGIAPAATPAVSTNSVGQPVGFNVVSGGWRFQALQNVNVVSLGYWDWSGDGDGFASSVNVGIWTDAGTPLGSLTVPAGASGTLIDGFRYADLTTPLSLSSGQFYRIAAAATAGALPYNFSVPVTESAAIDYDHGYSSSTANPLTFPTIASGVGSFFGPNFLYVTATGDYNHNGIVDAADYVVWRANQGTNNVLPNDPIGGTIGAAQYNQWRANFGPTAGSGAGAIVNAAVPEPATFVLLMFAATGWCVRRGRAA